MKIQRYGWRKDSLDARDKKYRLAPPTSFNFPPIIDLRPGCPSLPEQGQLGSCTGHGVAFAIHFEMMLQNFLNPFLPSRLLIYYMERVLEGTIASDAGAEIRDGIKCVATQGVTSELDWPYDVAKFAVKPPDQAFLNAQTFNALTSTTVLYQKIDQDLNHLKGCLSSGYPFVFGFSVFESFESDAVARTGMVPMPAAHEDLVGGHCVCAVGYDNSKQAFLCANWWGKDWGMDGFFYLPYDFITDADYANDFWKISFDKEGE